MPYVPEVLVIEGMGRPAAVSQVKVVVLLLKVSESLGRHRCRRRSWWQRSRSRT
jgi:hypothetical protein